MARSTSRAAGGLQRVVSEPVTDYIRFEWRDADELLLQRSALYGHDARHLISRALRDLATQPD
jgi:hypothetical protein